MAVEKALDIMKNVLLDEAQALRAAAERLMPKASDRLVDIFKNLKEYDAQLIFCGVGKSGYIGLKLAATFSSLGLRSLFLHPTEALHGDLGRIGQHDAVFFLSKSGTTEEILKLIPFLNIAREKMVAIVGTVSSPIAQACGTVLDCSVEKEACINNQAPTTSTTLSLAMGDAAAVLFEHCVDLSKEDFAHFHPGGILGKSLRYKVGDLIVAHKDCPTVEKTGTLRDVIFEMTKKPVGGCAVLNEVGKLEGIMVEGDIRRSLNSPDAGLDQNVSQLMTANPVTIQSDAKAYEALELMENRQKPINIIPVVKNDDAFEGFITLHVLIKVGFSQR